MTGDVVGGYRLVRSLGEGARAEVFLGHPIVAAELSTQVALKIYRADVPFAEVSREIDALTTAAGPHVVLVSDLSSGVDGSPVLIMEKLGGGSLASLLARRVSLSTGEAITILVPLAGAVGRLRAGGVAHGRLSVASVFFTDHGAPVLACFGGSVVTDATNSVERETSQALTADLASLRDLARSVLATARGGASEAGVGRLLEWMDAAPLGDSFVGELSDQLFDLGTPEPVQLAGETTMPSPPMRTELQQGRRRGSRRTARPRGAAAAGPSPRSFLSGALTRAVGSLDSVPGAIARVREIIAPVRARFWIIGAGVLATMVLALVLVPQNSSDAIPGAAPSPASSQSPSPSPSPTNTALGGEGDEADVAGDDPAVALEVLLQAREECIRSVSILCLDGVDQAGSAALAEDQSRVRALQGSSGSVAETPTVEIPEAPREFHVEERLGGAALVTVSGANSEPASILMIRSEAGWRIRDYLR